MQAGAKISALAPRCPGGWREDPGRIMEIKLVVWRGCHYVTVHIQSRAAMNCNHSIIFNTLSLGHKLSKIKKKKSTFLQLRGSIFQTVCRSCCLTWLRLYPQRRRIAEALAGGRARALAASVALRAGHASPDSASVGLARAF